MSSIKYKVLDECKRLQNQSVESIEAAMEDLQTQANEYGAPRDRYDAFRSQLLRKRDLFAKQLQNTLDTLEVLNRINPKLATKKVEFGAVVITDKLNLFVSIGIGKFKVDKKEYFAVSTKVPVFKAIEGLVKGDTYFLNGKEYRIKDIF